MSFTISVPSGWPQEDGTLLSLLRAVCINCHSQQDSDPFISRPRQGQPEHIANWNHHSRRFSPLEYGERKNPNVFFNSWPLKYTSSQRFYNDQYSYGTLHPCPIHLGFVIESGFLLSSFYNPCLQQIYLIVIFNNNIAEPIY